MNFLASLTGSELGDKLSSDRRDLRIDFGWSSSSSSVDPGFFFRIDFGFGSHSSSKSRSSSSWLPDLEHVRLDLFDFRIDFVDSRSSSSVDPDLEQVRLELRLDFLRIDFVLSSRDSGLWQPEPKLAFLRIFRIPPLPSSSSPSILKLMLSALALL